MASETDDQFSYNLMLANALLELIPAIDRQYIRMWFDALSDLDSNPEELAIRNEYIWFILLMLQSNKVEEYFKDLPPRKILPLRQALPQKLIDDVITNSDENLSWLDAVLEEEKEENLEESEEAPDKFLNAVLEQEEKENLEKCQETSEKFLNAVFEQEKEENLEKSEETPEKFLNAVLEQEKEENLEKCKEASEKYLNGVLEQKKEENLGKSKEAPEKLSNS